MTPTEINRLVSERHKRQTAAAPRMKFDTLQEAQQYLARRREDND